MPKINSDAAVAAMKQKFQKNPKASTAKEELCRDVCSLAEKWIKEQGNNYAHMDRRTRRRELRSFVMENIDLKKDGRSGFIGSTLWVLLATTIIKWIINWILENR